MFMMTADKIVELRKALGLSRTELGAKVGVSESCIFRWENGERHPQYQHAVKLNELAEGIPNGAAKNGKSRKKIA